MPFPSSSRISLACFSRCRSISILWFKGLMRISQSCDSSSGIKSCQAVWIIQDFLICFYNIFNASISEIDKGIEILFLTSLEPSYRLSTTKLHFKKNLGTKARIDVPIQCIHIPCLFLVCGLRPAEDARGRNERTDHYQWLNGWSQGTSSWWAVVERSCTCRMSEGGEQGTEVERIWRITGWRSPVLLQAET